MSKIIVDNVDSNNNNAINVNNFVNMPVDPAWVELIEYKDVSGEHTVAFDHTLEDGYNYRVRLDNVSHAAASATWIGFQLRSGSTWQTSTSSYYTRAEVITTTAGSATGVANMIMYYYSAYGGTTFADSTNWRLGGWMDFFNHSSTSLPTTGVHVGDHWKSSTYDSLTGVGSSTSKNLDAHNGIRLTNHALHTYTQGFMVLSRYRTLTS